MPLRGSNSVEISCARERDQAKRDQKIALTLFARAIGHQLLENHLRSDHHDVGKLEDRPGRMDGRDEPVAERGHRASIWSVRTVVQITRRKSSRVDLQPADAIRSIQPSSGLTHRSPENLARSASVECSSA